jgi:hypothetical protein
MLQTRWDSSIDLERDGRQIYGLFAGGDCVTGPATVIKAISSGKTTARAIDKYLGFSHEISVDVDIPAPKLSNTVPAGRVNLVERPAGVRRLDYEGVEYGASREEAEQEAARCLRCDKCGWGLFRGGRQDKW